MVYCIFTKIKCDIKVTYVTTMRRGVRKHYVQFDELEELASTLCGCCTFSTEQKLS